MTGITDTPAVLPDARVRLVSDLDRHASAVYKDYAQSDLWSALIAARDALVTPPASDAPASGAGFVLVPEKMRALSERATPGPWAWEQCGEKEDVPVIGIAFPGDDPDCETPYEGEFRDSDASRMTIAYDWQACDGHSPSANAAFAVAAVNYVRAMLAAAPKVASEAGEGDIHETMRLVEYDMTNRRRDGDGDGDGDGFVGERKEVATIITALRAALATDAADGATGASEAAGLRERFAQIIDPAAFEFVPDTLEIASRQGRKRLAHAKAGQIAALTHPAPSGASGEAPMNWSEAHDFTERYGLPASTVPSLATTPGGDLLEQAAIVDVVLPIIVQNTPSVGRSAHHVACDVADAVLRALSARNQTDDGGEA